MTIPADGNPVTPPGVYDAPGSPVTVDLLGTVTAFPPGGSNVISGAFQHAHTWADDPTLGPFTGGLLYAGIILQSAGPAHLTENQDGTGAAYDFDVTLTAATDYVLPLGGGLHGLYYPGGIVTYQVLNTTDRTLYAAIDGIPGVGWRAYQITTVPTTPPPPTNLPPSVIERKLLEALNPGFNCEIERNERTADLVTLFLGDKISLTVDGVRGRLGIIGRSHVVTRLRFRWQIQHDGDVLAESVTTTVTLEKIPGTLLGGAGTSSPSQDAAFTGGDMALLGGWDTAGAGWDSAGWAA